MEVLNTDVYAFSEQAEFERLLEENAVASWIVFETPIPISELDPPSIGVAITKLADTQNNMDADTYDRYEKAVRFYLETAQLVLENAQPKPMSRSNRAVIFSGLIDYPEWQSSANCLGVGNKIFFVERGSSTKPAKSICAQCEVKEQCLEYALDNNIKTGVWGGTDKRQRERILKQRVNNIEQP